MIVAPDKAGLRSLEDSFAHSFCTPASRANKWLQNKSNVTPISAQKQLGEIEQTTLFLTSKQHEQLRVVYKPTLMLQPVPTGNQYATWS